MPTDSQPDRPIQPYRRCSHIVRFSIGRRRGLRGFGVYVPFFHCAQFFPLASFRRMHSFFAVLLHASVKRKTWYHSFARRTECPCLEMVKPFVWQNSWIFA